MNILVILKQIPYGTEDYQDTGFLNDSDINVLMQALDLRDEYGGMLNVLLIAPPEGIKILKEAHTYGIDAAFLLSDPAFNGADIPAAAHIAATAALRTGPYDLILFGRQAVDGDSAHMAAMTAQEMGLPLIAYCTDLKMETQGEKMRLRTECSGDVCDCVQETCPPAVVLSIRGKRKGHYPTVANIMRAYDGKVRIEELTAADLGLSGENRERGRITVLESYEAAAEEGHRRIMLTGDTDEEKAKSLLDLLERLGIDTSGRRRQI